MIELLCVCVGAVSALSGGMALSVGEASPRGLCSSRIDFVLDKRLKGFGLFFFMTFGFEDDEGGGSAVASKETSDLEGPPTGFRVVDRSMLGSANTNMN